VYVVHGGPLCDVAKPPIAASRLFGHPLLPSHRKVRDQAVAPRAHVAAELPLAREVRHLVRIGFQIEELLLLGVVGHSWNVGVMRGEVEEERLRLMRLAP